MCVASCILNQWECRQSSLANCLCLFLLIVQVLERLVSDWCPSSGSELMPGFKSFAVQQLGGHTLLGIFGNSATAACNGTTAATAGGGRAPGSPPPAAAGTPGGPLDARDAATVALLGEIAAALKLLQERCGNDFSAHLCSRVMPESGLPGDVQQQLAYQVRESDAKQVKELLRELLLSSAGANK